MTQRSDTIELAYGLLWTLDIDTLTDEGRRLSMARKALLGTMDKQGQERGITAARAALTDGQPCGECHLKPGERCDICGKRASTITPPNLPGHDETMAGLNSLSIRAPSLPQTTRGVE
jgi:hypothetical protein